MDLFEVIRSRRSIRAYTPRPVGRDHLEVILQAANRAPSAGNLQAYQVYAVHDRAVLRRLVRAAFDQTFIAEAPVALVFCAEPERSAARYGQRGRMRYCLQDATIACAYAQLAATALGLATVWVGAFDDEAVRDAIGVGPNLTPVAILPMGHAAEAPEATPRRPLSSLVHTIA